MCWADQSVKEFDCDKHTDPIQVLEAEGSSTYSLREWSSTGDFELIHELDYFDGHVNAVGMYEGPSTAPSMRWEPSRRIRITTMRFRTCAASTTSGRCASRTSRCTS